MSSRALDRRLDWLALNMLYIAGPVFATGLAMLIAAAVFHG